jgi:hypothetical protein
VHVDNAYSTVFYTCFVAFGTTVDGDVHCMNNDPGNPGILGSRIGGAVDVVSNVIPPTNVLQVMGNTIGGTSHVSNNVGPGFFKAVQGNTVAKTLVCENNDPPFIGGPNVARQTQGQCF